MKMMMIALSIIAFAHSALASECDSDYLDHNEQVLHKVTSNNKELEQLGSAQRDCLAVELQKNSPDDDFCPTFRQFERKFLAKNVQTQIALGEACRLKLLN